MSSVKVISWPPTRRGPAACRWPHHHGCRGALAPSRHRAEGGGAELLLALLAAAEQRQTQGQRHEQRADQPTHRNRGPHRPLPAHRPPAASASAASAAGDAAQDSPTPDPEKIDWSKIDWKKRLSPEQFAILRQADTERPFTGEYYHNEEAGLYRCVACGSELFSSETKYESGSGWPSFYAPLKQQNIATELDTSHGMRRVEALCAACGGHLGHVFEDGPAPTGLRYCINSASLKFEKKPDE